MNCKKLYILQVGYFKISISEREDINMRLRDNKKYRNERLWKEKRSSRDKKENEIGVPTGFLDKDRKPILSGDVVISYMDPKRCYNVRIGVVLWDRDSKRYMTHRGCWYNGQRLIDPDCYGKEDVIFNGRAGCVYENVEVVEHLTGNDRIDKKRYAAVCESQGVQSEVPI
nr:MAG TPA: hypothetical protein [Caudoviricetes sp.]